jgi:hypothetical protein
MLLINFIPLIATEIANNGIIGIETEHEYPKVIEDPGLTATRSSSRAIDTFNLQPDWVTGQDTFLAYEGGAWVNKNFGNETFIGIGGDTKDYRSLIYFDLSPLPGPSEPIERAMLKLFFWGKSGTSENPVPVSIYRVKESWTEGTGTTTLDTTDGATWNNHNGANAWTSPGGYFHPTSENETEVSTSNKWYQFDITDVVSKWHTGQEDNYGILIRYTDEVTHTNSFKTFYSSDSDVYDRRPKLSVEYENSPPVITGLAPSQWLMAEDQDPDSLTMAQVFNDADGFDTLSFNLETETGEWGTIHDTTLFKATLSNKGSVSSPNYVVELELKPDKYGSKTLRLNATDKIRYKIHEIEIIVSSVNDDPILALIGDQVVTEEIYFELGITATDVEGNTLSFDANVTDFNNPDYLGDDFVVEKDKNDPNKAMIKYYPSNEDAPFIFINVTVEDGLGGVDYEQIKFTVQNINDAPRILRVAGDQPTVKKITLYATQGTMRNFIVEAEDDDLIHEDMIKFTSDREEDDNYTLDHLTGVVFFKPTNEDVPEVSVRITVTDLNLSTDFVDIKIIVKNVNDPPKIIKLVSPSHNAEFTTTEEIHFEAEYDDPDLYIEDSDEEINVTWFSDVEGAIGYGGTLDTYLSAGIHNITFKIKDKDPNTESTKITFTVKVTKAITLTEEDCDRDHDDYAADVVSYFYNIDKDKMEFEKGGEEDIDIIELKSQRIGNNLVIVLQVAGMIDSSKTYTLYLVKPGHNESTDFYKLESTNVYDTLYKPNSIIIYGEIPNSYRTINEDTITYTINLGDLEAGDIDGWTEGLKNDFDLFVVAKGRETERFDTGLFSVVSYESAGLGAAVPGDAPVTDEGGDDGKGSEIDDMLIWIILIIVIIVVLIVLVIFMKQKKGAKADIDYTGTGEKTQRAPEPSKDIPTLFQSPFEQRFGAGQQPPQQQPGLMPPGPGMAGGPSPLPPMPMPQTQQPQASKSCPSCRKKIVASSRMCPYCGNPA